MKFIKLLFIFWCCINTLKAQEVASEALKSSVKLLIHPTGNAEKEQTYIPLVYLGSPLEVKLVASLADYLVQKEGWPQLLIVGIDASAGGSLQQKLSSYTNYKSDPFMEFLADELPNYLDQNYSLHPYRILAGHQDAGAYVFTTMMDKQDAYQSFICLAPTFYHLAEAELYYRTFLVDHFNWDNFFYVAQGFGDDAAMKESLALSRLMLAHSIERPIDFHFDFFDDIRNSALLPEALPSALRKLFSDLDLAIMHDFGGAKNLWEKQAKLIKKYNFDPLNLRLPKIPVSRELLPLGEKQPQLIPAKFDLLWHQQPDKYDFGKPQLLNLQRYFQANNQQEAAKQLQKIINNDDYDLNNQQTGVLNNYTSSVDLEDGKLLSILQSSSAIGQELELVGADVNTEPVINVSFDGEDDSAVIRADRFNKLTGSFSLATWINPTSVARFKSFIYQAYQGVERPSWRVGFGPMAETQWGVTIWSNAYKDHIINKSIPTNTWTHLTVIMDQAMGEVRYYMNGENVGVVKQIFPLFATEEPILIGNKFHGSLSHMHFYERGLSAAEAKAIFEKEKNKFYNKK